MARNIYIQGEGPLCVIMVLLRAIISIIAPWCNIPEFTTVFTNHDRGREVKLMNKNYFITSYQMIKLLFHHSHRQISSVIVKQQHEYHSG
jgi:hypothetical protein